MASWLLDLNVLIARQDAEHEHHAQVAQWLDARIDPALVPGGRNACHVLTMP